jgi:hypothetical protein
MPDDDAPLLLAANWMNLSLSLSLSLYLSIYLSIYFYEPPFVTTFLT